MGSPPDKRRVVLESGAAPSWEDDGPGSHSILEWPGQPHPAGEAPDTAWSWPGPDAQPATLLRLAGLPAGAEVDAPLLIRDIQHRGGDYPHTILLVGNAAGSLPSGPIWASDRHRLDGLARGMPVRLRGSITEWRGRPQVSIDSIEPIPPDPELWPFLLPSIGNPAPWWSILDTLRDKIQSPHLREILAIFFDDNNFRNQFQLCPGSLTGHHGKIGGLLQHTCEVGHFSRTLAETFSRTDPELLVSSALLHDIGKLQAYRWDGVFELTPIGRTMGHVVLGTLQLDRAWHRSASPPCTPDELEVLHHLLLSHHGRLEHGSPVLPMTLEAELLHLADQTSARGASMQDTLTDAALFQGDDEISAQGVWQLDHRRVWRRECSWGRVVVPATR